MAQSPELQSKIQMWRQKAREGTLSADEMREAIAALRQDRVAASATSAAAKERKSTARAKKDINSDAMLDELEGL